MRIGLLWDCISHLLSFDDVEWVLAQCNVSKRNLQISVGRDIRWEKISPTLPSCY